MVNKTLVALFIMVSFGLSLIISVPILTLSIQLSTYDVIDFTDDSSIYNPTNASPVEKLNVYVEYGDIEIKYVSPLVNYFAKIKVNIEMSGLHLSGKNSSDYFDITWQDTGPTPSFTLEFKSGINKNETLSLIKNISVIVNLRADIIFDVMVIVLKGNVDVFIPYMASIDHFLINITQGNVFYDFNHCIIDGNITGIVNTGNIDLKTFNAKCTKNCNWNFTIENGDIFLNIRQFMDLGANITGLAEINNGYVYFYYEDDNPYVGAIFKIPFWSYLPFYDLNNVPSCLYSGLETCPLEGFEYQGPFDRPDEEGIIEFTSDDLLANNVNSFYDITFEIYQGSFNFDLTSFPDLED